MPTMNRVASVPARVSTLAGLVLTVLALVSTTLAGQASASPNLLESTFPSLGLGWGDSPYKASADLTGLKLPLINVTNPSQDRYVVVRVVVWSSETGTSRWILVNLEPRGSSTLSLEGPERFTHLSFVSKETFSAELLSADGDQRRDISVTRDVPISRDGALPTKSISCEGTWTLTCLSQPGEGCDGLGPFSADGEVRDDDQVYWQENVPTGSWTTVGDQGITATWVPGFNGCPKRVTNSISGPVAHTYAVTISGGGGGPLTPGHGG